MKMKDGVYLSGLKSVMLKVLDHAEKLWQENGQELVVTSTTEGRHIPTSLHPLGLAVDLRTRYFTTREALRVHSELVKLLGDDYSVILHIDTQPHIHVQYNKGDY